MTADFPSELVDAGWLADNLSRDDLVILDAGFYLPAQGRDARAEYESAHIAGARFFDIDQIANPNSDLPHMLPSPEAFATAVGALGIGNGTLVVVYDDNFFMASARAWWMFRVFGHDRVSVLNGGLSAWRISELKTENASVHPTPVPFLPDFRPQLVRDLAQMQALLSNRTEQVLDARSPGRFRGTEPEPRPGLRSGHMPGSYNLFFKDLIDPQSRRLRAVPELADCFKTTGIDLSMPITASCGTGVTAAILALALYRLGKTDTAIYDGSWTEWGSRTDTQVVQDAD